MPSSSVDEVEQYIVPHSAGGLNGTGVRPSDWPQAVGNSRNSLLTDQSMDTLLEELECESRNSNFQELLAAHLSEMQHALITRIDRVQMLVTRRLPASSGATPAAPTAVNGPAWTKGHAEKPTAPSDKTIVENLTPELEEEDADDARPSPSDILAKPLGLDADAGATTTPSKPAGLELVAAPERPPAMIRLSDCSSEGSSDREEDAEIEQEKPLQEASSLAVSGKVSFKDTDCDQKEHTVCHEKVKPAKKSEQDWGPTLSKVSFAGIEDKFSDSQSDSSDTEKGKAPSTCPACGNQYAPDAIFCRKCGRKRGANGGRASIRASGEEDLLVDHIFELLPVWQRNVKKRLVGLKESARLRSARGNSTNGPLNYESQGEDLAQSDSIEEDMNRKKPCWQRHTCAAPSSPWRGVWDVMSCTLVFYDMVMIPLEFLDPDEMPFDVGMGWVARIFWTLDFPASLCTGYVRADGIVERRCHKVAKRFLKTWFLFDVIMISVEWLELIWSGGNGMGFLKYGRSSRAFRIVRMVRLLRLIRIREILVMIAERVRSERLIIAADVLKMMVGLVAFSHVIACVWYGIGNSDNPSRKTWVREFGMENAPLGARYSNSLHWSLSQFSGGMDEIRPANTSERVFTIFTFLFAFLMASTLVSRLTSSMTRLHMLSNTQAQQLVALRKYLGENGISPTVALRIQKNAQHAIAEQQRFMPEGKVELLKIVSEPLLMELHFELYHQVMAQHPFFGRYTDECAAPMRKVCHRAVVLMQVGSGDVLFNPGEIPLEPKMYFINSGMLQYEYFEDTMMVSHGQWVSEATLWTTWMHRGTLSCTGNCRISVLDAAKFQDIVGRFEHPASFEPRLYAAHFVKEMNQTEGEITDLSTVAFPLSLLRRRHSRMGDAAKVVQEKTLMQYLGFSSQKSMGATGPSTGGTNPMKLARSFTSSNLAGRVVPEPPAPFSPASSSANGA